MKGAAGLEFLAGLLQLNSTPDNLDDIRSGDEIVNKILRNQSGHKSLNGSSAASGLFDPVLMICRYAIRVASKVNAVVTNKHSEFIRMRQC